MGRPTGMRSTRGRLLTFDFLYSRPSAAPAPIGRAAYQDRARRTRHRKTGDREGGRPSWGPQIPPCRFRVRIKPMQNPASFVAVFVFLAVAHDLESNLESGSVSPSRKRQYRRLQVCDGGLGSRRGGVENAEHGSVGYQLVEQLQLFRCQLDR
jgi:hypothetical protein